MVADINLLVVEQHAVDSLDGGLGSFCGLVVDETISLGSALFIGRNLAREDSSESGKGVVEGLNHGSIGQFVALG